MHKVITHPKIINTARNHIRPNSQQCNAKVFCKLTEKLKLSLDTIYEYGINSTF